MKYLIPIIIAFIFTTCRNKQTNDKTFLEKGLPESVNVNPELINKLFSNIKSNKIKNIHGLLIIKDDKLFTEEYFSDFNKNRLQFTASVSKSFASALLGIAIDKGYFSGEIPKVLDKSVSELFLN